MNIQELLHDDHDTDKNHEAGHSYGDFYEQLFLKFDRNDELNILELGVQKGGSLRVWKEYFPNAHVYGVDIIDSRLDKYKEDDVTYIVDDLKKAIVGLRDIKFDIIIDDSDHSQETMVWIAQNYYYLLKPKGILVFEDVQIPSLYYTAIGEGRPEKSIIDRVDLRERKGRHDDFIITLTPPEGWYLHHENY